MAQPQPPFADGEHYHIYNRGVEKRLVFEDQRDCRRFLETLDYYRLKKQPSRFSFRKRPVIAKKTKPGKPLVEILCYCLMPNHFHLLIKQLQDNGITDFISLVSNSYTKYFNTKYKRVGPLFQGTFRAVRIENDEHLIHLSRYIHLNPLIDYVVKDLKRFPFSSYHEYVKEQGLLTNPREVLSHFKSGKDYAKFVLDQEDYGRSLKNIERSLLDING